MHLDVLLYNIGWKWNPIGSLPVVLISSSGSLILIGSGVFCQPLIVSGDVALIVSLEIGIS